ncbi:MAG TPA: hypothetical protein VFX43_18980 [Chitinophagaceae bacterium]|nr:hypothetical protein [Chitinophagaceae bacterium]
MILTTAVLRIPEYYLTGRCFQKSAGAVISVDGPLFPGPIRPTSTAAKLLIHAITLWKKASDKSF